MGIIVDARASDSRRWLVIVVGTEGSGCWAGSHYRDCWVLHIASATG